MKIMMRNWPWFTSVLAIGLICASYLLAQPQSAQSISSTQTITTNKVAKPTAAEAADCARLIDAVNAGDGPTVVEILRNYGIGQTTLSSIAASLGETPSSAQLKEPFLKASVGALALADKAVKANVQTNLQDAIATLGYERPVWIPRRLETEPLADYEEDLAKSPVAPIAVLNVRSNEPCFIRYFRWYDLYAENLHSVVLNGSSLSNPNVDASNYNQANHVLNALFQLIKARKPDAFVWLSVVKEEDGTDEQWLKAMTFRPDGLQISNLRQFHSPFAETRARYTQLFGPDMPMMVSGFYGYEAALQKNGKKLTEALAKADRAEQATATAQLGGIGAVSERDLAQVETNLQTLGYRGLSAHWLLLAALANSTNAAPVDGSDLVDPRAGQLDTYFGEKDYARMFEFAAGMVSNSAPGDLNWTVGKLYEGIGLLSQSPPDTTHAISVLDEILAFDFKDRPGRDHYILGAAKWRIYAASLSGESGKGQELARWVQNQKFRADLKADFIKRYGDLLTSRPTTPQ